MTKVNMIHSGILFQNDKPYLRSVNGYFPSVVRCDNGDLVAAVVTGEAFEAINLRNILFRSKDNGISWECQGPLCEDPGPLVSEACRLAKAKTGELSAFIMRHDRTRKDYGLTNPDTLGFVPVTLSMSFSQDNGYTWSEPVVIDPPLTGPEWEMCSPVTYLDEECLLPTSTWPDWDGNCPEGLQMVAFRSKDQGRTWPEYTTVMKSEENNIYFWESKIIEIDQKRLLAVAWAYNMEKGCDLENHYAISYDRGKSFSKAMPTGLKGQTLTPLYLGDGVVMSAYRRIDQKGLWLNLAKIENDQWVTLEQIPLWGTGMDGLTKHSGVMSENFKALKFGAPNLLRLADGSIFLSFWCVEDGIGFIRTFNFTLEA